MPTYRYRDKDYSLFALRRQFPHVSFPASPAPDDLAPFGVTIMPDPEPLPPTQEEIDAADIAALKAELQHIDAQSIRPARAVSVALSKGETPDPADIERLSVLEAQAVALRTELQSYAV